MRLLSERGDRVWLTYNRSEERARDLIAKASGSPGLVNARQVNLEAAVETERFVKEVLSEETRVDGFVHCATSVYDAPITGLDFERTAAVTEVMLWSFARIAKLILPRMRRQRYGRLVAVSSLAAHRSSVGNGVYSAAKAALESLVRTIAVECGPKGVAACAIAPGLVNTDLIAKYTRMESIVGRVPLRRMAEPAMML